MIQPDKQVKDLYNAVLREVISTIREDPLILHAGIQSNVIDALEEKWRKNIQTARDSLNATQGGSGDLLHGYHPRPGYMPGMGGIFMNPGPVEPIYSTVAANYPRHQIQPRTLVSRPGVPQTMGSYRTPQEMMLAGAPVYQEDEERRMPEYHTNNDQRRTGFQPYDKGTHEMGANGGKRMVPGPSFGDHLPRQMPIQASRPMLGYGGMHQVRPNPIAGSNQGFPVLGHPGLYRMGSNQIGGNQNPPGLLTMKRTDSSVAVRNEEPLNEQPSIPQQEQQPLFQLALNFGDHADKSDNEEKVKKENPNDASQSGVPQTNLGSQTQDKPVKTEADAITNSQIKLEGDSQSDDDDDGLFMDGSASDKGKKTAVSGTPSQPATTIQPPAEALGKRGVSSDSDEDADDEDNDDYFNGDGEDDAPVNIGDKLKKDAKLKGSKAEDKLKLEPVNPRLQAVQEAIKPRETKVEALSSHSGSQNAERELNSEDDISEDSEFDAGNNSLLGYFVKVGRS